MAEPCRDQGDWYALQVHQCGAGVLCIVKAHLMNCSGSFGSGLLTRASRMGSMVSFSAVMLSTKWVNASALRARCPSSSANSATSLIHPTRLVWAKTGRWRSRWTKSRSRNGASTSSMNSGSTVSRSPVTALKSNFANRSEMAARAGAAPIDDRASRRCYKVIGRIRWPRGDLTSHPTQRH